MKRLLAFAAIYLIWGSTYLAIGVAVREAPPWIVAGTRFLFAGALLYAFARRRAPGLSRREWLEAGLAGLLFFGVSHGLGHWAQVRIPSGITAVLVATVGMWMPGLEAVFVTRRAPSATTVTCSLVAFLGVVVLLAPWWPGEPLHRAGVVAVLTAPIAWSVASLWSRRPTMPKDLLVSAGAQMLVGGAALLVLATLTGGWSELDLSRVRPRAVLAWLHLALFGSIVAFVAYQYLLTRVRPAVAATYAFVNPLIAVFLGALALSEELSLRVAFAAVLILVPVGVLQIREIRRTRGAGVSGGAARG